MGISGSGGEQGEGALIVALGTKGADEDVPIDLAGIGIARDQILNELQGDGGLPGGASQGGGHEAVAVTGVR